MKSITCYRINPAAFDALAARTGALIGAAVSAAAPRTTSCRKTSSGRPPSPAMMRRTVAPSALPVTAEVRARRAADGIAGYCAIAAICTVTKWTPNGVFVVGVLDVDVPDLPGWTVELSEAFTRPVNPTPEQAVAFREEIQAVHVGMLAELLGKVSAIQSVHGRTLLTLRQKGDSAKLGPRPYGLDSAAFAPRGKAALELALDRANALVGDIADDHEKRIAAQEAALSPLRMATDASHDRRRCGWAWVDENGEFGVSHGKKMCIDEAEAHAVCAALDHVRKKGGARRVIIESDSRRAVETIAADVDIERIPWARGWVAQRIREARELAADPRITVRWVRGHSGHPLNELADRLSRHERRSRQWNLERGLTEEQQQRIVADALPAIRDWVAMTAELAPVRTYDSGVAVIRRRLHKGLRDLNRELAGMDAGVIALYQKCVHLGCRVPECATSKWFECGCHGSYYNQVGEKKAGPAPRGLDRFAMSVSGGSLTVDTGVIIQGPPIGTNTTGQEAEGPHCVSGGSH